MKIVQYNLLAPLLVTKKHFPECEVDALDPDARFQRILAKLEPLVQEKAIFCLQEVSKDWLGRLMVWFTERNYVVVDRLYGIKFNDYMGALIAFPRENFSLLDCQLVQIGDLIKYPPGYSRSPPPPGWIDWARSWFVTPPRPPEDHWERARRKWNTMIWLRLREEASGKEFCLATYHMPCDFRRSTVMFLHSSLAVLEAQELADETPLVFAGDWNFKPDSPFYQLLTEGTVPEGFKLQESLSSDATEVWGEESALKPMTSVYVEAQGEEPPYTNFALTEWSDEPFIGTLDYIFRSKAGWQKVDQVIELPSEEDPAKVFETPLPTKEEPSDHLMLGAELELA